MQFKVPQFIDIEDKLGNLTLKQFIYLIGGGGLGYLCFRFLPGIIAIVLGPAFTLFGVALAFYKMNDKGPLSLHLKQCLNILQNHDSTSGKKKEISPTNPLKVLEETWYT